ncbi:MAG: hypothetical protein ACQETE_13585 [Bacteroidota bacterium]
MSNILIFVKTYWSHIIAISAGLGFIIKLGYQIWSDRKKKKQAYNRVFSAIIKLYYSYLRHKNIYSEEIPFHIPEEEIANAVNLLDTFENDLQNFSDAIMEETAIIPEASFKAHLLFRDIESTRIIDKIDSIDDDSKESINHQKLVVNRALFYATEEVFDDFFNDIIKDISNHTSVNSSFIEKLLNLNNSETETYINENREAFLKKYIESLQRQGVLNNNNNSN